MDIDLWRTLVTVSVCCLAILVIFILVRLEMILNHVEATTRMQSVWAKTWGLPPEEVRLILADLLLNKLPVRKD